MLYNPCFYTVLRDRSQLIIAWEHYRFHVVSGAPPGSTPAYSFVQELRYVLHLVAILIDMHRCDAET